MREKPQFVTRTSESFWHVVHFLFTWKFLRYLFSRNLRFFFCSYEHSFVWVLFTWSYLIFYHTLLFSRHRKRIINTHLVYIGITFFVYDNWRHTLWPLIYVIMTSPIFISGGFTILFRGDLRSYSQTFIERCQKHHNHQYSSKS